MNRSAIRAALLRDHDDLRARMRVIRAIAGNRDELRRLLTMLTDAVRKHNAREEAMLAKVFPDLDAWGPVRRSIMDEEHILEHERLVDALVETAANEDPAAAANIALRLFEKMEAHMAREERVFLSEEVLTDEDVPPDAFGG